MKRNILLFHCATALTLLIFVFFPQRQVFFFFFSCGGGANLFWVLVQEECRGRLKELHCYLT